MSARSGGWPDSGTPRDGSELAWFRGRYVALVSTRPVTGSRRLGGRRAALADRRLVVEATCRRTRRAPSAVASPERTSAAYASLISAMRRVATREAAGSSPVRSGWFSRASRRQAALIVAELAPAWTPRTTCGSRVTMTAECTACRPEEGQRDEPTQADRIGVLAIASAIAIWVARGRLDPSLDDARAQGDREPARAPDRRLPARRGRRVPGLPRAGRLAGATPGWDSGSCISGGRAAPGHAAQLRHRRHRATRWRVTRPRRPMQRRRPPATAPTTRRRSLDRPRLTGPGRVASPCPMGTLRRVGLVALALAPFGLAYRFALVYRARAGFPRRQPPLITPTDLGLPVRDHDGPIRRPGPAGLVHPGPRRRAGTRRRPRPRLGVRPRPDAPDGRLPARGRVPLPDVRCPRPRRERRRGAADQRRGVRRRCAGRLPGPPGPTRGHGRGDLRALDGRDRGHPRRGRRRPGRGRGRDLGAGRSVPADPPDVPAGPPARSRTPSPTRWPGSRPTSTSGRAGTSSARSARPMPSPGTAGPVLLAHGADDVVVPPWHMERLAKAATAGRPGPDGPRRRPIRRPLETIVVEGGQHSWLYEFAEYRRAVASFLATSLGGPLEPDDGRATSPPRHRPTGSPTARSTFAAVAANPGGLRTLAQVARPGATQPTIRDEVIVSTASSDRRRVVSAEATDPVWAAIDGRSARSASSPIVRSNRTTSSGSCDAGRRSGSSKNRQRWDFIVVRDRDRLQALTAVGDVGRAPGRCRRRHRARDARPGRTGRPRVHPVRPGPGRPEHDAGGLGTRDRQRAGHGVRLRGRPAAPRLSGRPHLRVPAVVRLPGRSVRPHPTQEGRRPAAARPRWSTRSAGSGRPTASGTSARRSRSTRPASRAGPRRRRTAARTRPRRP